LDVCIQLNQWEKAVQLSKTNQLRDVDSLLGKYTEHLSGTNEKTFAAVQLYRKAGKFLDAAKLIFEVESNLHKVL
jgi:WD repeat-containing protein 35